MSATATVESELKERVVKIAHDKLELARQYPNAVQHKAYEGGKTCEMFYVGNAWLDVQIAIFSTGRIGMIFGDGGATPSYNVFLEEDGEVTVYFEGASDADVQPSLAAQLDQVEKLEVQVNEMMLYGWAEGDQYTVLFYAEKFLPQVSYHELESWVLDGAAMPDELKMSSDDEFEWGRQVWSLIKQGKLVLLNERVKSLPGEVWEKTYAKQLPYMEFDASDGELPAFAAGSKYVHWHPLEEFAGQRFHERMETDEDILSDHLKSWLH